MAESAIWSVARQVSSLLVEEAKFLSAVEGKVEELEQELVWMQCFLRDVNKREEQDELVRLWASQVKDLAYKAEDVVEKYIYHMSSAHHGKSQCCWDLVKSLSRYYLFKARSLHQVGFEIEKLTHKILKLNTRLLTYGVKIKRVQDPLYNSITRDLRRRKHAHPETKVDDLNTKWLAREIDQVVEFLLHPDCRVVVVAGTGGVGRTALARQVYKNDCVKRAFEKRFWVHVSEEPKWERIIRSLMNGIDLPEAMNENDEPADREASHLKSLLLKEKNCLFVVHDVSIDAQGLDLLKLASSDQLECKILLIARSEGPPHQLRHRPHVHLHNPKLDKEGSWSLLRNKAFADHDYDEIDPQMIDLGKGMKKHHKGVPVAIIMLGQVLAFKSTLEEWKAVDRYLTDATKNRDQTTIPIATMKELCYKNLPFDLELCILCFGYFPPGCVETDRLFQLWLAEGLIRGPEENQLRTEGVCMYDIAKQYLLDLIDRGMVHVKDLYPNCGRVKTCRLNTVTSDICMKKCNEKFIDRVTEDDFRAISSPSNSNRVPSRQVWKSHRVLIQLTENMSADCSFLDFQVNDVAQLRSLFMSLPAGYYSSNRQAFRNWFSRMIKKARLLRVLHLQGVEIDEIQHDLGRCIHLRFLRLELHTPKVPSFVWKLYFLETLDLRSSGTGLVIVIPNKLKKLKRLVHLYLPTSYKVKRKLKLRQPLQMETLVNIDPRHLYEDDLQKLENLRLLTFAKAPEMETDCLKLVLDSNIITKKLLECPLMTLAINAEVINEDPTILNRNPHVRIAKLDITEKINRSVEEIDFPNTVSSLNLVNTELQGDCISCLKIPNLEYLSLKTNAISGNKIVFQGNKFPKLEYIAIDWRGRKEAMKVEGSLPARCNLTIWCSPELREEIESGLESLQMAGSPNIFD